MKNIRKNNRIGINELRHIQKSETFEILEHIKKEVLENLTLTSKSREAEGNSE